MNFLKLIYPDRCPICDRARPIRESGVCPECESHPGALVSPFCPICGRPVNKDGDCCEDCKCMKHSFKAGRSAFSYSSLNDSIYRFKYMKRAAYAQGYAKLMLPVVSDWLKALSPDAFVPVPLHKKRLIKRGYNQAGELAKELSKLTGIPVRDNLVERVRNTPPQKLAGRAGRIRNMKKAFIVKENVVKFRRIVIIDDIYTTGSTIDSVASELLDSGVSEVYFLTLTRAGI